MKERPTLFNDEMVRAVLDGRKTQTRRVVTPQPLGEWKTDLLGRITSRHPKRGRFGLFVYQDAPAGRVWDLIPCPYGEPGDRLWVREAHARDGWQIWYRSDCDKGPASEVCQYQDGTDFEGAWRPAIHMPRWASRITLEITDVRVERLQEISEEDAEAEGIQFEGDQPSPREEFSALWESINGPGSWDENPWVWVIEFKRLDASSS